MTKGSFVLFMVLGGLFDFLILVVLPSYILFTSRSPKTVDLYDHKIDDNAEVDDGGDGQIKVLRQAQLPSNVDGLCCEGGEHSLSFLEWVHVEFFTILVLFQLKFYTTPLDLQPRR